MSKTPAKDKRLTMEARTAELLEKRAEIEQGRR